MTAPHLPEPDDLGAFRSLFDALGGEAAPGAAPAVNSGTPAALVPAFGRPSAPRAFSGRDVEADAAQLRRSPAAKVGLVGLVRARLMGDESYRKAAKTLAARVDMVHAEEETKLAIFLAVAVRMAGFDGMTGALGYMNHRLAQMAPNSPEYIAGQRMIEESMSELPNLVHRIAERGTERMLKVGGQ